MTPKTDVHILARELLGREFGDLESDEQRVLQRVASGQFSGPDVDEIAQANETYADKLADRVAEIGGSWRFIIAFGVVLLSWTVLNSGVLTWLGIGSFDAYPFIFLNLLLSMLAAVQAPIILMSQNRQARRDRIAARHDYEVNLRTQMEILRLSHRIESLMKEKRVSNKDRINGQAEV